MAPKKLDTDPALEQLQQEGKQMSTTLMEQRQEWDRVKSLELAVGALQRSFDSTLSFLKPMRQQYLEGEEEKRRLMEMMKGKMHQIEESSMEEDGDGEGLFGGGERSAVGFASASTVKEPGGRSTEKERETTVVVAKSGDTSQPEQQQTLARRIKIPLFDGENSEKLGCATGAVL